MPTRHLLVGRGDRLYTMSGGNIPGRHRLYPVRRWVLFSGGRGPLHGLSDGNLLGERGGGLCAM